MPTAQPDRMPPTPDEIRHQLAALAARRPTHAPAARALADLLAARAELAGLFAPDISVPRSKDDRAGFAAGRPLLPFSCLPLPEGGASRMRAGLAAPLASAFPVIGPAVAALDKAFADGRLHLRARLRAFLADDAVPAPAALEAVGASEDAARMFLGQMAKTLAEAAGLACAAGPDAGFSGWTRGYCPLCGSMPELSFLQGKEGARMLSCGRCLSVWRFTRLACPVCETADHDKIELFYLDDEPLERAEACHACGRYVLGVDPRQRANAFHPSIEPLALIHLDVIMQEKGFTPAAAEPPVAP